MQIFINWGEKPSHKIVVLTAPHSYCPTYQVRACDTLSGPAALILYRKLTELGVPTALFMPATAREWCDLNRYWCRNTKYREILTQFLKENKDYIGVLFDIHSFPEDTPIYGKGDITPLYLPSETILTSTLILTLENNHIKVNPLPSPSRDDIIREAHDFDIPSILIEFKESLKVTSVEFQNAINAISEVGKLYSQF